MSPGPVPAEASAPAGSGSERWVEQLRPGAPRRDETVAALHRLLLRVAYHELSRRPSRRLSLAGPELDDVAHQAADDALVNVLGRLDRFRGESRFTTWAYKFFHPAAGRNLARRAPLGADRGPHGCERGGGTRRWSRTRTGWRDMELRHLRYFVAVADELHVSRAAARLHVAQPAVSEQVRKLEQELGVQLLDRTRRQISLTEAGAVFLGEARRVLEQARSARVAAQTARDSVSSRLRIGYVAASLPPSVPQTLQRLTAGMPSLATSMHDGEALALIDDVRTTRLDAAIVPLPSPTSGLRVTPLGEQRAVAALPAGQRQAVHEELRLSQIAPDRIMLLPREANRAFHDAVLSACRDAGIAPMLVELPDGHLERALLAVAAGTGMALLPQPVAERYVAPGVRFVRMGDERLTVTAAAVTRHGNDDLVIVALLRALTGAERRTRRAPERAAMNAA